MAKKFEINIKTIFNKIGLTRLNAGLKATIGIAKRAGSALRGIWNVKPVLYFRRAVVGAFAAIGIGGIKAASDMESLRAQLEAVLGDAEKAKAAFDESFDFSTATPFSPEDIVKTRIALESVGVSGADAVEKVATAAAAMGRNIVDVASAVRSMETEPLRNLGIMLKKDGDKFLFEYKDKMGKARQVSATGFAEAQQMLLDIMGGRFEGGLEKMSQTFSGLWSTMVGNLKASLADFGEQYLPSVKKGVQSVINALNELRSSGKLKEWGQAVNTALTQAAEKIAGLLKYVQTEGGKGARLVVEGVGLILVGHLQNAASAFLRMIAAGIPKIGDLLGDAWTNAIQNAQDKRRFVKAYTKMNPGISKEDAEDEFLKMKGQQFAQNFRGTGDSKIEAGGDILGGAAHTGNAVLNEEAARKQAERERLARNASSIQVAEAGLKVQRKEEAAAGKSASVVGLPTGEAMARLEEERRQSAELAALVARAKEGDQGMTAAMLEAMYGMVENHDQIRRELELLRSEVRTGRS